MEYIIPGDPVPLKRARFSTISRSVYNSQKTRQLTARIDLSDQHKSAPLFSGPLHVDVTFYMPISKTNNVRKHKKKPRRLAYTHI